MKNSRMLLTNSAAKEASAPCATLERRRPKVFGRHRTENEVLRRCLGPQRPTKEAEWPQARVRSKRTTLRPSFGGPRYEVLRRSTPPKAANGGGEAPKRGRRPQKKKEPKALPPKAEQENRKVLLRRTKFSEGEYRRRRQENRRFSEGRTKFSLREERTEGSLFRRRRNK